MKPGRIRHLQRQKLTRRLVITGVSILGLAAGIFVYLNLNNSEKSKAQAPVHLSQDALPVSMNVQELVVAAPDTNVRNGAKFKVAKSLSLTPHLQ